MRIRERRTQLALTQRALAKRVGIGAQQMSKYEGSVDEMSAGTLYVIATQLDTLVEYFFSGLGDEETALPPQYRRRLELMDHLVALQDKSHLEAVSALVRALAEPVQSEPATDPPPILIDA